MTVSKVGGGTTDGSASGIRGAVLITDGLVSETCIIGQAEYDTICGVHILVTVLSLIGQGCMHHVSLYDATI